MGRPQRTTLTFLSTAVLAAAALLAVLATPSVSAQIAEQETTTTTAAATSTTTTTAAPGATTSSSSTTTSTVAPTTSIYYPPVPPELAEDPRTPFLVDPGPSDGVDIPIAQNSFDPRSVLVRPELVQAAELAVFAAQSDLLDLQGRLAVTASEMAALQEQLGALRASVRQSVTEAAAARKALSDHAVTAYMLGEFEERLALIQREDLVDHGVAKNYVEVVVGSRERLLRRYEAARDGLSASHEALAADLGDTESKLTELTGQVAPAFGAVVERSQELAAYRAGAQAYVDGFVFPVAGDVEFIDSWGYPRMMGTASAHWHQGTDIFATHGTPLIASENGTLERIGTGTLGGNKLWVRGDSGNEYYYAHLAAFEAGIANGQRVRAGDVIGYVGDTGNARGTSPHLHFEIHPGGVGPTNPYPLLRAAYGNRPVVPAVVPTTVPAPAEPAVASPGAQPPGS